MLLTVYARRLGHDYPIRIKRIEEGWLINISTGEVECNKRCEPALFDEVLHHDSVNYPDALGEYFEQLWNSSEDKDDEWVQDKLNAISEWIGVVEKSTPIIEPWSTFK